MTPAGSVAKKAASCVRREPYGVVKFRCQHSMPSSTAFKWRHFQSDLILLNVRWYLRYGLSYRDLEEIMLERGFKVDHTTIYRWVQAYSPELDKRCRPYLKPTNDSWRIDETYCKIKGVWKYLYRAVDSAGNTWTFCSQPNEMPKLLNDS